jgi:zinc protease
MIQNSSSRRKPGSIGFIRSYAWVPAFAGMTVCLFFLISTPAYARDKILNIQEVKSPAGITAWLVTDHSVPVISLKFAFKNAGAVNDPPHKQGLARMASNTMDEGAGDLDSNSFQKELRDLSIDLHFDTTRDDFGGEVKTLTVNKDRAFELLALALTKPRFDTEAVDRMRAANQSRIRSSQSDPEWIAARLMNDIAFAGHPYAQNSGGTLSSLEKITPDDLRAFHKTLGKNNLVVTAAGDITKEQMAEILDKIFGALPEVSYQGRAQTALQNAGTVNVYKKDIPQTILEMIQPGIDHTDPDYETAQIMNFILGSSGFGSRLTEEIREKRGLTYGIYSAFLGMRLFDGMTVSTSTENKNAGAVVDLVKNEWKRIKSEPVSAKELADAKNYLIGSLPLAMTSTDKISELLLQMRLDNLPPDYLDQREAKIKTVTIADIQKTAQRILNEEKFTIIMVGAPENIKQYKSVNIVPNVE